MAKKQQVTTSTKIHNYGKNRLERLLRHLKKHPNDKNAIAAVELGKTVSTRKASNNKLGWMSSNKEVDAKLRTKFVGPITKDAVTKEAKILSFIKKAPFHAIATLEHVGTEVKCIFKHTSKLSNFTGKRKVKAD